MTDDKPANNLLEHSASGAGLEIQRQKREIMRILVAGIGCEGTIPGRSLA